MAKRKYQLHAKIRNKIHQNVFENKTDNIQKRKKKILLFLLQNIMIYFRVIECLNKYKTYSINLRHKIK